MVPKKVILISVAVALAVAGVQVAFYFTLLSILSNSEYAVQQFAHFKYYLISLALGFGIQIGLFLYLRSSVKGRCSSGKFLFVSGTASTTSMISCCALHLAGVLPVIGASGIISTLGQYQTSLYWAGLGIDAFGIVFILSRIFKFRRIVRKSTVAISILAITLFSILLISCSNGNQSSGTGSGAGGLESQTNQDGPVSITVAPQDIPGSASWDFQIALNTHSGDLAEDLMKVTVMVADGKEYRPAAWDGDPPGGHHRRGILKFAAVSPKPSMISLKIQQVGGVDERIFSWNL